VSLSNFWDYNLSTLKLLISLLGGISVCALLLSNKEIPIAFAIPFYFAISIIILTDGIQWGVSTSIFYDFNELGDRFNYTSSLSVLLGKTEYDSFGFFNGQKALDLVPLSICLLTQMEIPKKKKLLTKFNEDVLDDTIL